MREISPENLYLLLHEVYLGDSPVCHPHTHKLMNAAKVHPPNTSPPFYPSAPCPSSLLHLPDTPVSSNTIMSRSHFNFCTSQLKSEQRRWRRILFYPPPPLPPPPLSYLQNNLSGFPPSQHLNTRVHAAHV